jgi:predicted nuclease of predicted toxin-antitoxin system
MKILIDMNLSPLWVPFFAASAIEAVHWSTIGNPAAPDGEFFTHDLDFGALLAVRRETTPSVIQVRTHDVLPSGSCGPAVLSLSCIREARIEIERGALVSIDVNRRRIRMLPI